MTRASFTGAFDESCVYHQQRPTPLEEDGTNHCFVRETITGKSFVDTLVIKVKRNKVQSQNRWLPTTSLLYLSLLSSEVSVSKRVARIVLLLPYY